MAIVRVLLVESDRIAACATERALPQGATIRHAPSAEDARRALAEGAYTLGIVATRLTDGCGLSLAAWLRATTPLLPLLIVAQSAESRMSDRALDLGASFAVQPIARSSLRRFVGRCAAAHPFVDLVPANETALFRPALTPDEQRVLRLFFSGMRREGIAAHMGISLSMTKVHVRNILDKAGKSRLTDLRPARRHELPVDAQPTSAQPILANGQLAQRK